MITNKEGGAKSFIPVYAEKDRVTYEEPLVSKERNDGGEGPWSLHVVPTYSQGSWKTEREILLFTYYTSHQPCFCRWGIPRLYRPDLSRSSKSKSFRNSSSAPSRN